MPAAQEKSLTPADLFNFLMFAFNSLLYIQNILEFRAHLPAGVKLSLDAGTKTNRKLPKQTKSAVLICGVYIREHILYYYRTHSLLNVRRAPVSALPRIHIAKRSVL
jgi:hypothetical protein